MARVVRNGLSVADALTPVLREQAGAVRAAEADLRLGRQQAVHEFRVALRKLRSVIVPARSVFDSDLDLGRDLKAAGRTAGTSRDADVLAGRIAERLVDEPSGNGAIELRTHLQERLDGLRRNGVRELTTYVDGPEYDSTTRRLERFADLTPWSALAAASAADVLGEVLDEQRRRFDALTRRATSVDGGTDVDERLHDVRKQAKTVRYLSDALIGFVDQPTKKIRKAMRRVQTVLGDVNDSVLTLEFLDRLAEEDSLGPDALRVLGRVRTKEAATTAVARSEFADLSRRLP